MKHLTTKLILLVGAATAASTSLADGSNALSGLYVGGSANYDFLSADIKRPSTPQPDGRAWAPVGKKDFSGHDFGWTGTIGYDFYSAYKVPVRVAFLFINHSNADVSPEFVNKPSTGYVVNGNGKINSTEYMLNVYYDFHNHSRFTPYIGVGVGEAHNHSEMTLITPRNGRRYQLQPWNNDEFAWDVEAGLNYKISQHFTASIYYRYNNNGKLNYNRLSAFDNQATLLSKHLTYNQIGLGLSFNF